MTRSEVQVPHRPPVQRMLFCVGIIATESESSASPEAEEPSTGCGGVLHTLGTVGDDCDATTIHHRLTVDECGSVALLFRCGSCSGCHPRWWHVPLWGWCSQEPRLLPRRGYLRHMPWGQWLRGSQLRASSSYPCPRLLTVTYTIQLNIYNVK